MNHNTRSDRIEGLQSYQIQQHQNNCASKPWGKPNNYI